MSLKSLSNFGKTFLMLFTFFTTFLTSIATASAHVKWVVDTDTIQTAQSSPLFTELTTINVSLGLITIVIFIVALNLSFRISNTEFFAKWHNILRRGKDYVGLLLSLALGINLVLAAKDQTLFAMDLHLQATLPIVLQYIIGISLILGLFTRLSALATLLLFSYGTLVYNIGIIDYIELIGVAIYLLVLGRRIWSLDRVLRTDFLSHKMEKYQRLGMPVLRVFTGITLLWLGVDKWIHPEWGFEIIRQYHLFTFGFSNEIFVFGAGLVESAVGLLVIAGIFNRVVPIVVLLLFTTTAIIFPIQELLGHLILIAIMAAMFIEGGGGFEPADKYGVKDQERAYLKTSK